MTEVIRWFAVGREDLLDVLLGEASPSGQSSSSPPLPDLRVGKLALGYLDNDGAEMSSMSGPSLVIVEDESATETMSWLRAFADEAFPISQFARVVKLSDWVTFSSKRKNSSHVGSFYPERWASVSIGEVLAQAESDVDLRNMPLSRLASSLTLPVGRAFHLFGSGDATQQCVDRLRTISSDSRFARKPVTVSQFTPIWALCNARIEGHFEVHESVLIVAEAASGFLRDQVDPVSVEGGLFLERYTGLRSDSAEERVMAFNEFSDDVLRLPASQLASSGAFMLAAAAFMVGRSTSHAFLLNRFRRAAPAAFAWFGLIAALAGSRCWDGAWLRAVKGAERLLKPRFEWTDTSSADIGWAEFAWLAGSLDDLDQLVGLPKMLPRTLGVEVVPGVVLQVRLGQGSGGDEMRAIPEISARERALTDAINQILEVALQVRGHEVRRESPERGRYAVRGQQSQQSLDLENRSSVTTGKTSRSKKGKRDAEST
ncbi:hypothetical protein E6C76_08610 [Pseudothauera nasutitermitis]|uniref:Uncharacterized protein n=1 Tax=Pseudothauera nasutitermitis TaxID=2565930 RepID=A0A4S4AZM2_9RHOO|nr:hypothetical protein [Pseudothauera nasutitermitis]THF65623.1 hypothetical protein E6C76_08610 [Pseudothauera nasutitermitis]